MDDPAAFDSFRRPSLAASVRSSAAIAEALEDPHDAAALPAQPEAADASFRPQRQSVPHQVNMDVPSSDDDDEGPSVHPRGASAFLAQRAASISAKSNASMWSSPGRVSGGDVPSIRYGVTLGQLANSAYFHLHEEPPPLMWTPKDAPAADAGGSKEKPLSKLRETVRKLLAVANLEVAYLRNVAAAESRAGAPLRFPMHGDATPAGGPPVGARPPPPLLTRDDSLARSLSRCSSMGDEEHDHNGYMRSVILELHDDKDTNAGLELGIIDITWLHEKQRRLFNRAVNALSSVKLALSGAKHGSALGRVRHSATSEGLAADESQLQLHDDLRSICNLFAAYMVAALDDDVKAAGIVSPYLGETSTLDKLKKLVKMGVAMKLKANKDPALGPRKVAELAMKLVDVFKPRVPTFAIEAELLSAAFLTGHVELAGMLLDRMPNKLEYELLIIKRLVKAWNGYTSYGLGLMQPLQESRRQHHTIDWLDYKSSCTRAVLIAHRVLQKLLTPPDAPHAAAAAAGQQAGGEKAGAAGTGAARGGGATQAGGGLDLAGTAPAGGDRGHAALHSDIHGGGGGSPEHRPDGPDAMPARPPLTPDDELELTETKWSRVMLLFARPAACKPLALAMLYRVLEGKKQKKAEARAARERDEEATARKQAALRSAGAGAGGGAMRSAPSVTAQTEEYDSDAEDPEEAAEARRALDEKEKGKRYHDLQKLAVQAGHLAVWSTSLAVVSDAIRCIKAVRAWPKINLEMLNDLAQHFPQQAQQLLMMVRLEEVDMEDNVLPFSLPLGFVTVAVSDLNAAEFGQEGGSGSTQDAKHFSLQHETDASIDAALVVQARTWLALVLLFWPREFLVPTTRKLVKIMTSVLSAFMMQGIGSTIVCTLFVLLIALLGLGTRVLVAVWRMAYFGVLQRLLVSAAGRFPEIDALRKRMRSRYTEPLQKQKDGGAGRGTLGKQLLEFTKSGRKFGSVVISRKAVKPAPPRSPLAPAPPPPPPQLLDQQQHGAASGLSGFFNKAFGAAVFSNAADSSVRGIRSSMSLSGGHADGAQARPSTVGAMQEVQRYLDEVVAAEAQDINDDPLAKLMSVPLNSIKVPAELATSLWRRLFARGHDGVIDRSLGWGRGSASITCRKVPLPIPYASPEPLQQQLDTMLMEKLLRARNVHPSVFGTPVMKAMILFKWNYFTRYFILLQLVLHVTYTTIFIMYAWTLKDLLAIDGREHGPGSSVPHCKMPAPTRYQQGLLITLSVLTVDFLWQELRQIWHFGPRFFSHAWDLLDCGSICLFVASISLHYSCSSGASPSVLRGLASVQIGLLFLRLLYYAMASDKLGSFVRMVLETARDLVLFFLFLAVIFVGFALSIITAQGPDASVRQTFIKLFTMIFGDFDVSFLDDVEAGALGLDDLTRVLAALYMVLVTIILLNLLIAIINESYERIRENEQWESLRNKALLVVESETQLFSKFLNWLYRRLCPPTDPDNPVNPRGDRWLYIIIPERARVSRAPVEDDEEDDESEDEDDEEEAGDDQWTGRMGELKRHTTNTVRSVQDSLKRELTKLSHVVTALAAASGVGPGHPGPAAHGHHNGLASHEHSHMVHGDMGADECGEPGHPHHHHHHHDHADHHHEQQQLTDAVLRQLSQMQVTQAQMQAHMRQLSISGGHGGGGSGGGDRQPAGLSAGAAAGQQPRAGPGSRPSSASLPPRPTLPADGASAAAAHGSSGTLSASVQAAAAAGGGGGSGSGGSSKPHGPPRQPERDVLSLFGDLDEHTTPRAKTAPSRHSTASGQGR